jgi:hypothetical protein
MSTITSDVATIQSFASSSTLSIIVDDLAERTADAALPHARLHDWLDVLAGLGLHPDCPRHYTFPSDGGQLAPVRQNNRIIETA